MSKLERMELIQTIEREVDTVRNWLAGKFDKEIILETDYESFGTNEQIEAMGRFDIFTFKVQRGVIEVIMRQFVPNQERFKIVESKIDKYYFQNAPDTSVTLAGTTLEVRMPFNTPDFKLDQKKLEQLIIDALENSGTDGDMRFTRFEELNREAEDAIEKWIGKRIAITVDYASFGNSLLEGKRFDQNSAYRSIVLHDTRWIFGNLDQFQIKEKTLEAIDKMHLVNAPSESLTVEGKTLTISAPFAEDGFQFKGGGDALRRKLADILL